jgi:hypothetical protein
MGIAPVPGPMRHRPISPSINDSNLASACNRDYHPGKSRFDQGGVAMRSFDKNNYDVAEIGDDRSRAS